MGDKGQRDEMRKLNTLSNPLVTVSLCVLKSNDSIFPRKKILLKVYTYLILIVL